MWTVFFLLAFVALILVIHWVRSSEHWLPRGILTALFGAVILTGLLSGPRALDEIASAVKWISTLSEEIASSEPDDEADYLVEADDSAGEPIAEPTIRQRIDGGGRDRSGFTPEPSAPRSSHADQHVEQPVASPDDSQLSDSEIRPSPSLAELGPDETPDASFGPGPAIPEPSVTTSVSPNNVVRNYIPQPYFEIPQQLSDWLQIRGTYIYYRYGWLLPDSHAVVCSRLRDVGEFDWSHGIGVECFNDGEWLRVNVADIDRRYRLRSNCAQNINIVWNRGRSDERWGQHGAPPSAPGLWEVNFISFRVVGRGADSRLEVCNRS